MLIEGVTWRVPRLPAPFPPPSSGSRYLGPPARRALAAVAPLLPALATAAVLTAVLLALNLYEAWLVRTSHALPLLRWPGGGGEPARIPELADAHRASENPMNQLE